ncbi:MAG: DegV family protein [Candidatus Paceibacterota bacterium]|jgi:hypothetical protein
MKTITPKELKKMVVYSCQRIERDKENINKINVFPVPDQDTGNNLAKTLAGIRTAIEGKEYDSAEDLTNDILEASLSSAQGNAGVIYTGFLAGFLSQLNEGESDARKLAAGFRKGSERARQSIQHPKDGTILDVVSAAAKAFEEGSDSQSDIPSILKDTIKATNEALLKTREQMELYRKANVVDAGGLGFLMILESYLEALKDKKISSGIETRSPDKVKNIIQIISARFEVVALIESPRINDVEMRKTLARFGNSLDIVQIKNKMKIHIHTDLPDDAINAIKQNGRILTLRTQDMTKEVIGEPSVKKTSIGLITDGAADLSEKIAEHYNIDIIPFVCDWPEESLLHGENIYQKMRDAAAKGIKNLPRTSQPPPKDFINAFKKKFDQGFKEVLCVTLSSGLSGSYNSACQARDLLPEEQKRRVHILDSLNATASESLVVLKAIELVQMQKNIKEIMQELEKEASRVELRGLPDDPKWLEWGGRLSPSKAQWLRRLKKINVNALLMLKKGKIEKAGFQLNGGGIAETVFKEIMAKTKKDRSSDKNIRVVVTHCDNPKEAQKLKEMLRQENFEVSFVGLIGSVIGVHMGPGSIIAAWTIMD